MDINIMDEVARQVAGAEDEWMIDEVARIVGDEIGLFKVLVETLRKNRTSKAAENAVKEFLDRHNIEFLSYSKYDQGYLGCKYFHVIAHNGVEVARSKWIGYPFP